MFCFEGRRYEWRYRRHSTCNELNILRLGMENCWHWADFGIRLRTLSSSSSSSIPAKTIIRSSSVSPPVLLRIAQLLRRNFLSCFCGWEIFHLPRPTRQHSRPWIIFKRKNVTKWRPNWRISYFTLRRANWLRSDESKSSNRLYTRIQNFPHCLLPTAQR